MERYSPSPQEVNDLKDVLARYYAERVQKEADALWDEGILGEEAIESILKEDYIALDNLQGSVQNIV